jgi:hypothetical protein
MGLLNAIRLPNKPGSVRLASALSLSRHSGESRNPASLLFLFLEACAGRAKGKELDSGFRRIDEQKKKKGRDLSRTLP